MADKQPTSHHGSAVRLRKYKKRSVSASKNRAKRNKKRSLRRKRSRLRFIQHLKSVRVARKNTELCESIERFTVQEMDCQPLVTDVAEWQSAHQAAYWKSRAISLEFENRMLHDVIKKIQVNKFRGGPAKQDEARATTEDESLFDEETLPPKEQVGKAQAEEMKKLYGDEAARVSGMQTAVQLSYDYLIDKFNPPYWPNIPFKA